MGLNIPRSELERVDPDERVGPDQHKGVAPFEPAAQRGHDPAGGFIGAMQIFARTWQLTK